MARSVIVAQLTSGATQRSALKRDEYSASVLHAFFTLHAYFYLKITGFKTSNRKERSLTCLCPVSIALGSQVSKHVQGDTLS